MEPHVSSPPSGAPSSSGAHRASPSGSLRVNAPLQCEGCGPGRPAGDALLQRVLRRQTHGFSPAAFGKRCVRERFSHFSERLVCDVYSPQGAPLHTDFLIERRSRILEIALAGGLIFALSDNGLCVAFDMDTGRRVCTLNENGAEVSIASHSMPFGSDPTTPAEHHLLCYAMPGCALALPQ
jgi:hypothetical protein